MGRIETQRAIIESELYWQGRIGREPCTSQPQEEQMTIADPDKQRGLYRKYELYRVDEFADHRFQVFDPFFVLRYTTDPHAKAALAAYADSCEAEYPQLAADLRARLT